MTDDPDQGAELISALAHLGHIRGDLIEARCCCAKAQMALHQGRAARCAELAAMLAEAESRVDRITILVTGDLRADGGTPPDVVADITLRASGGGAGGCGCEQADV